MVLADAHLPEDVTARTRERQARTTISRRGASTTLAPGSSGATCSARSAANGPTKAGKAGGATTRPTTTDVFVLTHHARKPDRNGGRHDLHFVTDGIHAALERARAAAKGKDVRLGGGVSTIRQYLEARPDRRDAPRGEPGSARPRRASARWPRPARARLRADGIRRHARRGALRCGEETELDRPVHQVGSRCSRARPTPQQPSPLNPLDVRELDFGTVREIDHAVGVAGEHKCVGSLRYNRP